MNAHDIACMAAPDASAEHDLAHAEVGRIVAVSGGRAVIMLNPGKGGMEGFSPEIGTLLKVDSGDTISLALVSSLSMPVPDAGDFKGEVRIVEVEFIGEIALDENGAPKSFRRGVSNYPGLGDAVRCASREELIMAYAANEESDSSIRIGVIHQDKSIPAMVDLDEMLGKHFAILGTTGTGKSCSVALILRRILERNPNAHILLLDMHREYAAAFSDMAEVIKPEDLNLPFWLLNFEEICEILVGKHAHAETDTEVLRELIPLARARYKIGGGRSKLARKQASEHVEAQNISVDAPLPYRTSDLLSVLDDHLGKLDLKGNLAPYKRIKAKLESVIRDPRYAFMFGSLTVNDSMAEVISRLFRVPVLGKPIAVLELGGLPSEVINVVVSVLARLAFDFALYSGGKVPITFVCEEAHRYVPNDPHAGFEPTRRAISRIAKEGRKYGVSLCIITQRPSELDPTILSQCNTVFSLRLTNEKDQEILRAGISDSAASLLDFMPTMGVGEAVAFGEGVSLPTRICIDLLPAEHLPRSTTAAFTRRWQHDIDDSGFLWEVVERWRNQELQELEPSTPADAAACNLPGLEEMEQMPASADVPSSEAPHNPPHDPSLQAQPATELAEESAEQVQTEPAVAQTEAHMPRQDPGLEPESEPTLEQQTNLQPDSRPRMAQSRQHMAPGVATPSPASDMHASCGQQEAESGHAGKASAGSPPAGASSAGGSSAEDPRAALRNSLQEVLNRFRNNG